MTTSTGRAPFEELAAKARRINEAVELVRGRAESAGGRATVEVDAAGRITELTITDAALSYGAKTLAAIIAETQRTACEEAAVAAQALRDELAADPRVTQVVDRIGMEAAAAQPHQAAIEEDEDQYYANMSILRNT